MNNEIVNTIHTPTKILYFYMINHTNEKIDVLIYMYVHVYIIMCGATSSTCIAHAWNFAGRPIATWSHAPVPPGWKRPRTSTKIRRRMRGYRSRVTMRYRSVPPRTVHFRFDRKLKNHGVASTLRTFEPSEPRLQHARSRSTIIFVYRRNAIVPFFTLNHTHFHQAAGCDWAWTARNSRNR